MLLEERLERIIKAGTLTLIGLDGRRRTFGSGSPAVTVRLCRRGLEVPFLLDAELAFPEAYMDGGLVLEEGDIRSLLQLVLGNVRRRGSNSRVGLSVAPARIGLGPDAPQSDWPLARQRRASLRPVGEIYWPVPGHRAQYSCAYPRERQRTLETAQRAKERQIAAKLLLRAGTCTWWIRVRLGCLGAASCASFHRRRVSGVTLSKEQVAWGQRPRRREAASRTGATSGCSGLSRGRGASSTASSRSECSSMSVCAQYDEFFAKIRPAPDRGWRGAGALDRPRPGPLRHHALHP